MREREWGEVSPAGPPSHLRLGPFGPRPSRSPAGPCLPNPSRQGARSPSPHDLLSPRAARERPARPNHHLLRSHLPPAASPSRSLFTSSPPRRMARRQRRCCFVARVAMVLLVPLLLHLRLRRPMSTSPATSRMPPQCLQRQPRPPPLLRVHRRRPRPAPTFGSSTPLPRPLLWLQKPAASVPPCCFAVHGPGLLPRSCRCRRPAPRPCLPVALPSRELLQERQRHQAAVPRSSSSAPGLRSRRRLSGSDAGRPGSARLCRYQRCRNHASSPRRQSGLAHLV